MSGRASSGNGAGIEGQAGSSQGFWAGAFWGNVYIGGNLFVTGTKSAVVQHPDGSNRTLFALESPESWFEDFGRARLRQGRTDVALDPDFAAIARAGDDYHVFLTPEGDSNGLYVTNQTSSGFEVVEQQAGTSDTSFSFRIVTRRRDLDSERLPVAEIPEATTAPEQVRDAWASIPTPSWPPETSQWPHHLAQPFNLEADAE